MQKRKGREMYCYYLLLVLYFVNHIWCTTDISLPELEFIANHLEADECWKLAILLHSASFETPDEIEKNQQQPILADVNCLEQLLHWNSQPNEGLDGTHVILAHRLIQINRKDLADWLTKTVFEELGKDLNKTVWNVNFKDLMITTTSTTVSTVGFLDLIGNYNESIVMDHNVWKPYDTISIIVIILLIILLIWLTIKILTMSKMHRSTSQNSRYKDIEVEIPLLKREVGKKHRKR